MLTTSTRRPAGNCRAQKTTDPSVKPSPDLFIPDHRGPSAVVLPTYVVPTCVTSTYVVLDCVTTPAPAGSSREAEIGTNLSTMLPTAGTELSRISNTAEMEPCRFTKWALGRSCQSVNSGNYCSTKFTDDMDHRSLHAGERDAT